MNPCQLSATAWISPANTNCFRVYAIMIYTPLQFKDAFPLSALNLFSLAL
jgi:hypothetical protein